MSSSISSRFGLQRRAVSSLVLCLLLGAAAALPDSVHADGTCQSRKRGSRAGRGSKSKAASQPTSTPAPAATSDDVGDALSGLDDESSPKPPEPIAPKQPVRAAAERVREEPTPEPAADEPVASESVEKEPSPSAAVDAAPESENAAHGKGGPSVLIEPYAGIGIAMRSLSMPSPMGTGVLRIAPGVTPAAEIGLRVLAWPSADFSFFVNLVYQSALGFSVTERPPLALEKEVRARSERVALELAPRWRLADGKLDLALPVGATVRTLWAEVHLSQTPSYSLVGPHVRAELRLVLSDSLSLRLAPELQYILMVDQDVVNAGVSSQGVALGGDASVDAQISRVWSIRINYRESHALLSASRGNVSFEDVERYLTLRAVGSF
jgi:hypothetical protein